MASRADRLPGFARLLKRLGVLLIVGGLIAGLFLRFYLQFASLESWVGWLLGFCPALVLILGAFLLYRGKQYAARARAPRVLQDERPPVIYLRPFSRDESMAGQVLSALLNVRLFSGLASKEEQLAQAVEPIGPLVAIGQPGERLPTPGAARAYASDAEWQDVVNRWLSKARLVILLPGQSQGVWWELERCLAAVPPERFLILLPRLKLARYREFAESVQARFGIVLPRFETTRHSRIGPGFLAFSGDWGARFLRLRSPPYWHAPSFKALRQSFHQTLQPVFSSLGVEWRPSPISIGKVASMGVLGLLAVLLLLVAGAFLFDTSSPPDSSFSTPVSDGRGKLPLPHEPPALPAPEWVSSNVAGLGIFAPGTFEPKGEEELQELWTQLRSVARDLDFYQLEAGHVSVLVERVAFKPGVQFQVEAGVKQSLESIARTEGVTKLRHSIEETQVSGYPALRVFVSFTQAGKDMRLESLSFSVRQRVWMVVATMPDEPGADETLARILDSVRLAEPRF